MKNWISYIKENLDSDIWGFIFIDYYYRDCREKHGEKFENYKPNEFIDENISKLISSVKKYEKFHKVFLKICVQLLFDYKLSINDSMEIIFKKSYDFLKKNRNKITDKDIEEIIAHYGKIDDNNSYKKEDVFRKYLIEKGFMTKIKTTQKGNKIQIESIENHQNVFASINSTSRKAILVTAIEDELKIVKGFFKSTKTKHHPDTNQAYESGIFESWDIMILSTGKFNDESETETALLIEHFKPQLAIFIGTAGRLDTELKVGDIIIPEVVVGYNYGKDLKGKFKISHKNIRHPSSPMIQYAKAINRDSKFMQNLKKGKGKFSSSQFNIIIDEDKSIASGNITVKDFNSRTAKLIKKEFPEAVALDMEGIGFLKACKKFKNVEYLLIRSISDYLKGKSEMNKRGSRQLATTKATEVAFEVLRRAALPI